MILYCRLVVKSFAKNDSISDLELQKIDSLQEWSTSEPESTNSPYPKMRIMKRDYLQICGLT